MMKKFCLTILTACLTLFYANVIAAQEYGRFKADVIVGGTAAQINGDDLFGFDKPGLELGVGVRYDLSYNMDLGVELLYSQQGSRNSFIQNPSNNNITFALNYAYIPVLLYYKDWEIEDEDNPYHKIMAVGGFAYGNLISSNIKSDFPIGNTDALQNAYNKSNIYYVLGAQLNFTQKFGMAIRYNRSISKVFNRDNHPDVKFDSLTPLHLSFHLKYSL